MAKRKTKPVEELDEDELDSLEEPAARRPEARPLARRALGQPRLADGPAGVVCPHCGCGHSRVTYTWDATVGRRRKRLCRHCGQEFATTER